MHKHLMEAGTKAWIDVYDIQEDARDHLATWSTLIPNKEAKHFLASDTWGLWHPSRLEPGCTQYGNQEVRYHRFGNDKGYEPLVLSRNFNEIKPDYLELSEEFRQFHNLYFDRKNDKYVKIGSDGSELDVVHAKEHQILIRAIEIKQFLAIKEMRLALLFDMRRKFPQSLAELGLKSRSEHVTGPSLHYSYTLGDIDFRKGSFVRVLGKTLVEGFSKADSGFWPYNEESQPKRTYMEFITGLDEKGREISQPCLPYGDNYLTPVHFRSEVLSRYYDNPSKYSVEDGYLRCGSLWGVHIDNDNPDYVTVFLGDIGRDIPEPEHNFWRSFNIAPTGPMSSTAFRRSFLCEFTNPNRKDLLFKQQFTELNRKWRARNGWYLFKPLSEADQHCFVSLRTPATDEQSEFDTQVMYLTKVLVDSLNEAELSKYITSGPNDKGIGKLESYLRAKKATRCLKDVELLRDIQALRSSGAAHRKSQNYEKVAAKVGLSENDHRSVFDGLMARAVELLAALENI